MTKSVEPSPRADATSFAVLLARKLGREQIKAFAKGDGAFVVVEMCERLKVGEGEKAEQMRKEMSGWWTAEELEELRGDGGKGRGVLVDKILALS